MSTQPFIGSPSEAERLASEAVLYKNLLRSVMGALRVALPGIIQSFDSAKQTVTVDLAIRDSVVINAQQQNMQIPTLLDVPIVVPRSGGYAVTTPINPGDECLVVFADMCINAWYQNGGIQNQEKPRRHSLSDGFAILGCWSQQRLVSDYSANSLQVRSDDGTQTMDVGNLGVDLAAAKVTIENNAGDMNITGNINVTGNLHVSSGATGTVSTGTGAVLTIQDGIIISIQ